MTYRVIVPYGKDFKKTVSYPGSGCRLYTKDEAIAVLRRFHNRAVDSGRNPKWHESPYAEGETERFTIFDVDSTLVEG